MYTSVLHAGIDDMYVYLSVTGSLVPTPGDKTGGQGFHPLQVAFIHTTCSQTMDNLEMPIGLQRISLAWGMKPYEKQGKKNANSAHTGQRQGNLDIH